MTSLQLCRLCRNLNLRLETFIDQGWRYPTCLEYESIEDFLDCGSLDPERHYVSGERLGDEEDYTDQELARQIRSPSFINEFDERGLLTSVRPVKKKVLGSLAEIIERASECVLCQCVERASKLVKSKIGNGKESSGNETCRIRFDYEGQGRGY